MQPQISWTDLSNSKVGIWGYGLEGKASEAKLLSLGNTPVIVDESLAQSENDPLKSFDTGGYELLAACDYVLKSPGISRYGTQAKKLADDTPLLGALGIWLQGVDPSKVICVTGTKGKSTTSALVTLILETLGHKVFFGGNIGRSPLEVGSDEKFDYWVLETSSFQVTDLSCAPKVVGLTSLHPDHVNWHGSLDQYYLDKLSITKLPGLKNVISNADDLTLQNRLDVKNISAKMSTTSHQDLENIIGHDTKLRGSHNRSNMALAIKCVEALLDSETSILQNASVIEAVTSFAGLEHRFQTVGRIGSVEFINDSLSTNALPTIAALKALAESDVAIILGGFDRGVDYTELVEYLLTRLDHTFIACIPDTGVWLKEQLILKKYPLDRIILCEDLKDATTASFEWAKKHLNSYVLLSPAAASFNSFKDYKERGEVFSDLVSDLEQ